MLGRLAKRLKHLLVIGNQRGQVLRRGITNLALPRALHPFSLAPASGSVFTLLPPDNATGNFTKVVQRVPVRIRVPFSVARENLLRPGMSVLPSIQTKAVVAANLQYPHGQSAKSQLVSNR